MNQNTIKPVMTQEVKARFFAQYIRQAVYVNYNWNKFEGSVAHLDATYLIIGSNGLNEGYLKLTPLSDITDEDAIEVAKIIHGKEDDLRFKISMGYERNNGEATHDSVICVEVSLFIPYPEDPKYYLHQLIQFDPEENDIIVGKFCNDGSELSDDHGDNILHAYDYLRSKGYGLPWMGYSVESMVESGWVKLKGGK